MSPHSLRSHFGLPLRLQFGLLAAAALLVPLISGAAQARKPSLDAPAGLAVSRVATTSLDLSWQPPTGGSSLVRYSTYLNGASVATGLRALTYSFQSLQCGTSYTLGVVATLSGRQSSLVAIDGQTTACATVGPPPDTTPPTAPSGVHQTANTDTSVTVGWTASSDNVGVSGYGTYVSSTKVGSAPTTSYTFTGLTCGTPVTVGVSAFDAAGNQSAKSQASVTTADCATSSPPPPPPPPAATNANLYVAPGGSDANACTQAAPCGSLDGAYQKASPGNVVQVAAGTYGYQRISARTSLQNLSNACSSSATAQCVHFVGTGVTIDGQLEIRGSDIWIDGGTSASTPGFKVTGLVQTYADSNAVHPDHVIVQGVHSASIGVFNTDTATFRWMDIGPATVSTGCNVVQGPGGESMIGFANGATYEPQNITLDGVKIHDQNGDSGRIASDCHWGGLFIVTANGLTIKNSTFENNVVYNVEIQNFVGPPATNVTFSRNSFGCPVDWLYNGAGCDGQSSIQFDGTFSAVTIAGNAFADGVGWWGQGWGCYRDPCDFSGDSFTGNTFGDRSTAAPPLP